MKRLFLKVLGLALAGAGLAITIADVTGHGVGPALVVVVSSTAVVVVGGTVVGEPNQRRSLLSALPSMLVLLIR